MMLPISDSSVWHFSQGFQWFDVQDLFSNAHYAWVLNPILLLLSQKSFEGYTLLLCFTIVIGSLLNSEKTALVGNVAKSVFALLGVITLFGVNVPLLSFLASLYFGVSAWKDVRASRATIVTWMKGGFALLLSLHLSPLLLVWCLLSEMQLGSHPYSKASVAFFVALLILPFFVGYTSNLDYPEQAFLIPGYGTPFGIDPLISHTSQRPFIDREFTERLLLVPTIILFGVSLFFRFTTLSWNFCFISLGLVSLISSSAMPLQLRMLGPLAVLSRIIPGWSMVPLYMFFVVSIFWFISEEIFGRFSHGQLKKGELAILVCTIFLISGVARPTVDHAPFGALFQPNFQVDARADSPSLYLVQHEPNLGVEDRVGSFHTVRFLGGHLTASRRSELLKAIYSRSKTDRWSPERGMQDGTEWIKVSFDNPVTIFGLDLSVPINSSDFPRGLEIEAGMPGDKDCTNTKSLYKNPRWLGSIFQTPKGLPYYSPQSQINIPFESTKTSCVLIKQIGQSKHYEWSVEILRFKTENNINEPD